MTSTSELLHQIAAPGLSPGERARLRCQLVRQLEEAGNYEAARRAMGDLWSGIGERPLLKGLDERTTAEVVLRAGVVSAWLGSGRRIAGAQALAKRLINESLTLFEELNEERKVAEAQIELALCFWREGALDAARSLVVEAIHKLRDRDDDLKALALLRRAIVEKRDHRLSDALAILTTAAPLFETSSKHILKGSFHNELGNVLNDLGADELRDSYVGRDYIDRALVEYATANFHFKEAQHVRYQAYVENNIGTLFLKICKFNDAHEHLDRAQVLLTGLRESVQLAQIDDTRARVLLAENRLSEAERTIRMAIGTLEKCDERPSLAEALTTQGIAVARLHHPQMAYATLRRAADVAEQAGDLSRAGETVLVMIEELSELLTNDELCTAIERARGLLEHTQDISILRRLAASACRVLNLVQAKPGFPPSVDWTNFCLSEAVLRYESHFIQLALAESAGRPTRAARLLGFKHHQSLLALLNGRHKHLRSGAAGIKPRRRSIMLHRDDGARFSRNAGKKSKARASGDA